MGSAQASRDPERPPPTQRRGPTHHPGDRQSLRRRKLVEEVCGWLKTVGGSRKLRYIGRERDLLCLEITAAAYDSVRVAKPEVAAAYGGRCDGTLKIRPADAP